MTDYGQIGTGGSDLPFDPYDDPRPAAKAKIIIPAIGLLVIGILCFLGAIYSSLDAGRVKAQLQEASRRMQKTEGMPPETKKMYADWIKWYERAMPILNGLSAVFGALVAIGGFQMLTLSARTYCFLACIVSMIPFATSCCCCLGLIFGIWGIFMLMMPDVKAAFAMQAFLANQKIKNGE